jgi:hypothetical protein
MKTNGDRKGPLANVNFFATFAAFCSQKSLRPSVWPCPALQLECCSI